VMLGRAGQGRAGQDRTGQDRTGQDRTGQCSGIAAYSSRTACAVGL
jgi:hypothetical protein